MWLRLRARLLHAPPILKELVSGKWRVPFLSIILTGFLRILTFVLAIVVLLLRSRQVGLSLPRCNLLSFPPRFRIELE